VPHFSHPVDHEVWRTAAVWWPCGRADIAGVNLALAPRPGVARALAGRATYSFLKSGEKHRPSIRPAPLPHHSFCRPGRRGISCSGNSRFQAPNPRRWPSRGLIFPRVARAAGPCGRSFVRLAAIGRVAEQTCRRDSATTLGSESSALASKASARRGRTVRSYAPPARRVRCFAGELAALVVRSWFPFRVVFFFGVMADMLTPAIGLHHAAGGCSGFAPHS